MMAKKNIPFFLPSLRITPPGKERLENKNAKPNPQALHFPLYCLFIFHIKK